MSKYPIETAPKDGTWILLGGGRTNEDFYELSSEEQEKMNNRPVLAFWSNNEDEQYWAVGFYDGGWGIEYEDPTYWRSIDNEQTYKWEYSQEKKDKIERKKQERLRRNQVIKDQYEEFSKQLLEIEKDQGDYCDCSHESNCACDAERSISSIIYFIKHGLEPLLTAIVREGEERE